MSVISFKHHGDFTKTYEFMKKAKKSDFKVLDRYGEDGVRALASATPVDSGRTRDSWGYRVLRSRGSASIEWYNTNVQNGVNIAVIIQYGHGTGTGGYVQGRDYINPALQPIFDEIAEAAWKEVTG